MTELGVLSACSMQPVMKLARKQSREAIIFCLAKAQRFGFCNVRATYLQLCKAQFKLNNLFDPAEVMEASSNGHTSARLSLQFLSADALHRHAQRKRTTQVQSST